MRRWKHRAAFLVTDVGLREYKQRVQVPDEAERSYASGHMDFLTELAEVGHYSVLIGYLRWFGGSPEIIDIGCGEGLVRSRIGEMPFDRYLGIDPVPAAIELAASRRGSDERTEWIVGDFESTDVGTFDVAILSEVLYYAADPKRFLDRVHDIVRPDGVVLVSCLRRPGDRVLWQLLGERFTLLDAAIVKHDSHHNTTAWRVACYER